MPNQTQHTTYFTLSNQWQQTVLSQWAVGPDQLVHNSLRSSDMTAVPSVPPYIVPHSKHKPASHNLKQNSLNNHCTQSTVTAFSTNHRIFNL